MYLVINIWWYMARNQKFPLAHYKVHFLERTTEEPLSQAREIRGLNMGADCEQMVEYCDKNEHGWILQMRNNADTHTRAHTHTRTYGTWIILAIDQLGCESSVMLSVTRRLSVCNNITPRFPRRSLWSQLLCLLLNGKSLRWNIHPHTLLSLGAQESQLRSH